jgi:hypothetical protein
MRWNNHDMKFFWVFFFSFENFKIGRNMILMILEWVKGCVLYKVLSRGRSNVPNKQLLLYEYRLDLIVVLSSE